MSRPAIEKTEAICREYPCLYCGAQAGEACTTSGGNTSFLSHVDRFSQAVEDGRLPTA